MVDIQFFNNSWSCLMNHVAVDPLSLPSAAQPGLHMTRLVEERGVAFATRCSALFHTDMKSRVSIPHVSQQSLGVRFAKVDDSITRQVELEALRAACAVAALPWQARASRA